MLSCSSGYTAGVCYGRQATNEFLSLKSGVSPRQLSETGAKAVGVNVYGEQKGAYNTAVTLVSNLDDSRYAAGFAKGLGMPAFLRPVAEVCCDPGQPTAWRGFIQYTDAWFKSYTAFALRVAELAQAEAVGTSRRAPRARDPAPRPFRADFARFRACMPTPSLCATADAMAIEYARGEQTDVIA
jgi:hypothetical protein